MLTSPFRASPINAGDLVVNNGEILRVRDEFKNISGTATFENNASLIQVNNVSNSGNITYKRIAQQKRLDYVYWSSPVKNFNLNSHPSNGLKYLWNTTVTNSNGTQGNWQPASGIMNAAKGYIISGPSSFNNSANQNLEVPFFENKVVSTDLVLCRVTPAGLFIVTVFNKVPDEGQYA